MAMRRAAGAEGTSNNGDPRDVLLAPVEEAREPVICHHFLGPPRVLEVAPPDDVPATGTVSTTRT